MIYYNIFPLATSSSYEAGDAGDCGALLPCLVSIEHDALVLDNRSCFSFLACCVIADGDS